MKGLFTAIIAAVGLLLTAPANAEQKQIMGSWEVHYNAFNSTFIQAEIAAQYGLERGEKRGLINIAILDADSKKAISVQPEGYVANPRGGVQNLDFTRIEEGDSVYYLAGFIFGDEDLMKFTINFPQSDNSNTQLEFEQKFYKEE